MTSRPSTRLILHIADPDGNSLWALEVQESIDEVINHLIPSSPPSSMLEHRANATYTLASGARAFISPNSITAAYEILPEDG